MLTMTGAITTVASGTNSPLTKARPQTSSTTLSIGKKYPTDASPSLNVFTVPVIGGTGTRLKKNVMEAKINSSPINVRTMIIAIFIFLCPPKVVDLRVVYHLILRARGRFHYRLQLFKPFLQIVAHLLVLTREKCVCFRQKVSFADKCPKNGRLIDFLFDAKIEDVLTGHGFERFKVYPDMFVLMDIGDGHCAFADLAVAFPRIGRTDTGFRPIIS